MTEQVIPGSRERGDDTSSKPVLSRHARRVAAAATPYRSDSASNDEAAPAPPEREDRRSADVGFEISVRTSELPDPTARPDRDEDEGTERDVASPAEPVAERSTPYAAAAVDRSDPAGPTSPDAAARGNDPETVRAEDGANTGSGPSAPVAHGSASSSPRAQDDPVARRVGDEVRRVEASEVSEADPGSGGWMSALIPIPGASSSRQSDQKKVPFWKRIALTRNQPIPPAGGSTASRPLSLEPILTRLSALEKQLAANQSATEGQLARFEENITRLWELEEQLMLTEVRERLALLEANQREIADALHTVGRNLTLLAVVLAAGLMAGLLALGLLL